MLKDGGFMKYFFVILLIVMFTFGCDDGTTEAEIIETGMIALSGGSFMMGDTHGGGTENEYPVHEVMLDAFMIGALEVTNQDIVEVFNWAYTQGYLNCSNITVTNTVGDEQDLLGLADRDCPLVWNGFSLVFVGNNYSPLVECPCVEITWWGALAYCNYLSEIEQLLPVYDLDDWSCNWETDGYRLPTEAEWEYAARGAGDMSDYLYSGNDIIDLVAWFVVNSENHNHSVGEKQANSAGIFDMSGSVTEWCWDWYSADYYESSPVEHPKGADSGEYRVVRGGSWRYEAINCRCSSRQRTQPVFSNEDRGFRVCRNQ